MHRGGECLWHILGKVGVCFSHCLPRSCCGAASLWTSLLPLAHADPELTLLPKSLEISAAFMAAMRPSIISEGATMWQPAGKDQRCREVPKAVTLPAGGGDPGCLQLCQGQCVEGRGSVLRLGAKALSVGARPSLLLGLLKVRRDESVRVKLGYRCQDTPHLLWHRPVPLLPAAGS